MASEGHANLSLTHPIVPKFRALEDTEIDEASAYSIFQQLHITGNADVDGGAYWSEVDELFADWASPLPLLLFGRYGIRPYSNILLRAI